MDGLPEHGNCYSVTRQIIPGDISLCPPSLSLIVNCQTQVDVLDSECNPIASRTKQKQVSIQLNGLSDTFDVEQVADHLCDSYEFLRETRHPYLVRTLVHLRKQLFRPSSLSAATVSRALIAIPAPSESAPTFMSPEAVDHILRDSPTRIHWGKEKVYLETLTSLSELAKFDRNLTLMIQNDALMNTMVNNLKKFATTSCPRASKSS
jgi:hypothetical protein